MSKPIGMIEFKTTATGITAADAMVKTSEVEIVEAQTVCPGKYIAIITGDLSAGKAAVDAAVTTYEDKCIDSFVLGNPCLLYTSQWWESIPHLIQPAAGLQRCAEEVCHALHDAHLAARMQRHS